METIKINYESELVKQMQDHIGTLTLDREEIVFLNKGEEVGRIELPRFTTEHVRHLLARMANVKEFDDFLLINEDGDIRAKASETTMKGFSSSGEDSEETIAQRESRHYSLYMKDLHKIFCSCCNQVIK